MQSDLPPAVQTVGIDMSTALSIVALFFYFGLCILFFLIGIKFLKALNIYIKKNTQ